jgi:hypothetical protein
MTDLHYKILYNEGVLYGYINFEVGTTPQKIKEIFCKEIQRNNLYQMQFNNKDYCISLKSFIAI